MAEFMLTTRDRRTWCVFVDDADYDRVVAAGPWWVGVPAEPQYTPYVLRGGGARGKTESLHRFLTGAGEQHVDHIDGNGLNNQRANLRLATRSENMRNRRMHRNNTSGFKGVSWHKRLGKWSAGIRVDGRKKSLGYFATPELAHAAYCAAAEQFHGAFARTG